MLGSKKEFVTEAWAHGPGHGAAYRWSELSVIPLSYSGAPGEIIVISGTLLLWPWSACSPSTLAIQVQILQESKKFCKNCVRIEQWGRDCIVVDCGHLNEALTTGCFSIFNLKEIVQYFCTTIGHQHFKKQPNLSHCWFILIGHGIGLSCLAYESWSTPLYHFIVLLRIKAKMEKDRNSNTVVLSFSVPEKNKKKRSGPKQPKQPPNQIPAITTKLKPNET